MNVKIVNYLSKKDHSKKELLTLLNIKSDKENQMFYRIIRKLIKHNTIVVKNGKYHLINNPFVTVGIFSLTKEGFGFIDTDKESYFVNETNTLGAMTGDKVKYTVIRKERGGRKSEAEVLEVLEKKLQNIVGAIIEGKSKDELFGFKPYSYTKFDYKISHDNLNLTIGDVVVGQVKGMKANVIDLEVTEIIGQTGDNDIDIKQVLFEKGIPTEFSSETLKQVKKIEIDWDKEKRTRKDLTDEVIVTIDGEDAKDLDDAIMIKKNGDQYLLSVSIADVSYFVQKDTPLDEDAFKRGTSVYLINTVVPMLPKEISNNLSSLNEDGVKLTITCDMKIDKLGKFVSTNIYPSYIKSAGRLTYTEVNGLLKDGTPIKGRSKEVNDMLLVGKELSAILRNRRKVNNMIDFNLSEMKLKVDENGDVTEITERIQDKAESLIEDFMVAANEAVATWFVNKRIPSLYRVHDAPLSKDIATFKMTLKQFDIKQDLIGGGPVLTPKAYQKIIDFCDKTPYGFIVKKLAIQSMTKAIYDFRNRGHFGLGLENYTHFTSPIRRYPDLIIHRLLRHHLFEGNKRPLHSNLSDLGIRTSYTEKRAMTAERALTDKKISKYMVQFVGQEFEGFVTSVQKWGFFVQLPNTVEGLVSTKQLAEEDQDYLFNNVTRTLTSKDKKTTFKIGDKVKVTLYEVDVIRGLCDFRLVR